MQIRYRENEKNLITEIVITATKQGNHFSKTKFLTVYICTQS